MDKEEELACAQCFLQWYNQQHGTTYNEPLRADELFPELNSGNWDFIAIPKNNDDEQRLALEVKGVIRPNIRIQVRQWQIVFRQVSRNLQNTLNGTFHFSTDVKLNPPESEKYRVLNINHAKQPQFVNVLTDIIGKAVVDMNQFDQIDLGPQILAAFPSWPVQYRRNSPVACPFCLMKSNNKGNSVHLLPIDAFWEEAAIMEALENLDMARQLGLARSKGFQRTVLLLDLPSLFSWDPQTVRQWLIDTNFSAAYVSSVYLIQVSGSKVAEVWSASQPPTKARDAIV